MMLSVACLCLLGALKFVHADYAVNSIEDTGRGFKAHLHMTVESKYPDNFEDLTLETFEYTEHIYEVKIAPQNSTRWEPKDVLAYDPPEKTWSQSSLTLTPNTIRPFTFSVDTQEGYKLFNFDADGGDTDTQLFFADQFMQISTKIPFHALLNGLGIRMAPFLLPGASHYDLYAAEPNGVREMINLYSVHPFLMVTLPPTPQYNDWYSFGIMFHTSDPMDVDTPDREQSGPVKFHFIGGIIDMFIIDGPTADEVIKRYHELVGMPYFHPRWSLGVGQSSFEYFSYQEIETMIEKYEEYGIPLDNVFTDINAMHDYEDFTYEPVYYEPSKMQRLVRNLHKAKRHYVPILDPGQNAKEENKWYMEMVNEWGLDNWTYVRCPASDQPIINACWPGKVALPDFTSPSAREMWGNWLYNWYHDKEGCPYDGLWIDMNDPSLTCVGECNGDTECGGIMTSEQEKLRSPPYEVGQDRNMMMSTLDLASRHMMGNHYDLHNMYAFYETMATRPILDQLAAEENRNKKTRALLLSRGSFLGSGRMAATWLGDNDSSWEHLLSSVSMIQQANLHGISLAGPDTCGFSGTATEELCTRWYALGLWYPFLRNHYMIGTERQEPFIWGETTANIVKDFLHLRYTMLPYMYSLLYSASRYGDLFWKPIYYEFPEENLAPSIFNNATLVGRHVFIKAIGSANETQIPVILPRDAFWRDLSGQIYNGTIQYATPIEKPVPTFFRSGSVIPRQYAASTLQDTSEQNMYLMVVLPPTGLTVSAPSFRFYYDDGITVPKWVDSEATGVFVESDLSASFATDRKFKLCNSVVDHAGAVSAPPITAIYILGAAPGSTYSIDGIEGTLVGGVTDPSEQGGWILDQLLSWTTDWCTDIELLA